MQKLTDRQREVLAFIANRIDTKGAAPTMREMGEALGFKSTNSAAEHLRALETKGCIRVDKGLSRGVAVLDVGRAELAKGTTHEGVAQLATGVPVAGGTFFAIQYVTPGTAHA